MGESGEREGGDREREGERDRGRETEREREKEKGIEEKREREVPATHRSTLNLSHELGVWSATDLQDSVEVITV